MLLDPNEGNIYNKTMNEDAQTLVIKSIYNITTSREDYFNPTSDGELSWRIISSYEIDSKDAMDIWKNKFYEVSTKRYTRITKVV